MSPREAPRISILNGWKEIANHLGRGVRTVQRYETALGLPIRRPANKARGSVLATTAELDAWIAASPLKQSFALRRAEDVVPPKAFKTVLVRHHQLLEEMVQFRAEMQAAMEMLQTTVHAMRSRRGEEFIPRSGVMPSESWKRPN